jgi:hypothetical protein
MAFPESLQVGLKEWEVVCQALGAGEQTILLRKGGIYEASGEFEIEHRHFLLFPTWLHQSVAQLKPAYAGRIQARTSEPSRIELALAGEITDIIQLQSRAQMQALSHMHIWSESLIDMRFAYKPSNPLYLLIVRAWALAAGVWIENVPAYAGCKSWVPLNAPVSTHGATPVLSESTFQARREAIRSAIIS